METIIDATYVWTNVPSAEQLGKMACEDKHFSIALNRIDYVRDQATGNITDCQFVSDGDITLEACDLAIWRDNCDSKLPVSLSGTIVGVDECKSQKALYTMLNRLKCHKTFRLYYNPAWDIAVLDSITFHSRASSQASVRRFAIPDEYAIESYEVAQRKALELFLEKLYWEKVSKS